VRYVQLCLLTKIWCMAQIVPLPAAHTQQLTTIYTWFIWQGATFRVAVTTLQRPKEDGNRGFPNVGAKCRTLLYNRIQMLGVREETVISEQMRNWDLTGSLANPAVTRIPHKLIHIRQYAVDMADLPHYAAAGTRKAFKRRVFDLLLRMDEVQHKPPGLWIVRKYPGIPWGRL